MDIGDDTNPLVSQSVGHCAQRTRMRVDPAMQEGTILRILNGMKASAADKVKRAIDIVGSGSMLALAAPVMLGTAVTIRLTMGRPVLFRQRRPGKDGLPFTLLKFRTMRMPSAKQEIGLGDQARITKVGQFLRSTSIDELPSLWNVFRGEMSLVGPRPLLMHYLPLYSPRHRKRHAVKPGVTGWAQVNGRNSISWSEKFELDIWYVENHSLALDFKVLARTALRVLQRSGIGHQSHVVMPEFTGYNDDHATESTRVRSRCHSAD
jgi:lipopolysaccharide/colanic/teichoic acid biosynthesis glycosyltransferase